MPSGWDVARAERHLRSLELFGMRFGLDRMRRMMTVLGYPQRSLRAIHVVGTNGKSSTTRMIAAILERHGLRTGAYTSPHLVSYEERVQVGERDISTQAFAAAIARAAWAAERVNHTLAEDDHVTQFELLTAAALWELARRDVEVAIIEAGLGGRYDATNVLGAPVAVLTNVGLEHTRWLGPTVTDIAREKLDVVGRGATLALGVDVDEDAFAVARGVATERDARIVRVDPAAPVPPTLARGSFQRRNLALARLVAQVHLESLGMALNEDLVAAAAASTAIPGRLQVVGEDPLTVFDGAHNADATLALVESLPELVEGRPLGLVMGVLDDKDAATMLSHLLPLSERGWFTAPPGARALPPATLQSLARQRGCAESVWEPRPERALAAARSWARGRPRGAVVLALGSIYLIGELMSKEAAETARRGRG
jgi:dihydrofolate synthase/folylpolyglutamate synthase